MFLTIQNSVVMAAAWNLKKGKTMIITEGEYRIHSIKSEDYDYKFKEVETGITYNHEYGLSDNWNIGLNGSHHDIKLAVKSPIIHDKSTRERFHGKDFKVSLKRQLYLDNNSAFAMQVSVNDKMLEMRMLLGRSHKVKKQDRFINLEIANRSTKKQYRELIADFTTGSHIDDSLMVMNQIFLKYIANKHIKGRYYIYPASNLNDGSYMQVENMFAYRAKLQQKISLVKKINQTYRIAFGVSNYFSDKGFLGNSISLGLWIVL